MLAKCVSADEGRGFYEGFTANRAFQIVHDFVIDFFGFLFRGLDLGERVPPNRKLPLETLNVGHIGYLCATSGSNAIMNVSVGTGSAWIIVVISGLAFPPLGFGLFSETTLWIFSAHISILHVFSQPNLRTNCAKIQKETLAIDRHGFSCARNC